MKSDSEEFVDPCGGTHINNSSEIRKIRIISETGIQANIRRIILVSGDKADEAEKNAAELYEQLKKGKVVNLDILLPLFDRNEIEEINKENTKKIAKETNEILKKNADGLKEQILNYKVQKMMKNSVFAFELENISELSKKEVLKGINSMGDLLKKESVTGFVHARVGKELLFTINTEDSNFVLEKLSESIKGLNPRIIKRFVQGNLLTNSEKDYYEKVDVLKQKIL